MDQQMSVLAHELCHIAFRHASEEQKDPQYGTTPPDAVINQMLKRDGLELSPSWIDIEAIGYDAGNSTMRYCWAGNSIWI